MLIFLQGCSSSSSVSLPQTSHCHHFFVYFRLIILLVLYTSVNAYVCHEIENGYSLADIAYIALYELCLCLISFSRDFRYHR